jgi:hypothetical protein
MQKNKNKKLRVFNVYFYSYLFNILSLECTDLHVVYLLDTKCWYQTFGQMKESPAVQTKLKHNQRNGPKILETSITWSFAITFYFDFSLDVGITCRAFFAIQDLLCKGC